MKLLIYNHLMLITAIKNIYNLFKRKPILEKSGYFLKKIEKLGTAKLDGQEVLYTHTYYVIVNDINGKTWAFNNIYPSLHIDPIMGHFFFTEYTISQMDTWAKFRYELILNENIKFDRDNLCYLNIDPDDTRDAKLNKIGI